MTRSMSWTGAIGTIDDFWRLFTGYYAQIIANIDSQSTFDALKNGLGAQYLATSGGVL